MAPRAREMATIIRPPAQSQPSRDMAVKGSCSVTSIAANSSAIVPAGSVIPADLRWPPPLPHRRGGLGSPSSSKVVSGSRSPNSLAIGPAADVVRSGFSAVRETARW